MSIETAPRHVIEDQETFSWQKSHGKSVLNHVVQPLYSYSYIDWTYINNVVLPGPNRHTSEAQIQDAGERVRAGILSAELTQDTSATSYMGLSMVNAIASSRYRQIIERGWKSTRLEEELDLLYELQLEKEEEFPETYYYPAMLRSLVFLPAHTREARSEIFSAYQRGERGKLFPLIRAKERENSIKGAHLKK